MAEFKIIMTAVGDEVCIVRSLGEPGKETAHLCLTLQVELLRLEAHAVGFVDGLSRLDAHEHVLVIGVAFFQIVCVIGHHERNAGFPAESN